MNQKIIVRVSANQELEIPDEIKHQLQPLSEYEIVFNQERDELVFKKVKKTAKNHSSILRPSSGKSILRHAGTWQGDDFEECLQTVYENRSQIQI